MVAWDCCHGYWTTFLLESGSTVRRHVDSIRKRYLQQTPPQEEDAPRPPEPQVDQEQSQGSGSSLSS